MRVIRVQFSAPPARIENRVDPPRQVIGWDHVIKTKIVEKSILKTH